jgi:hypothetical protein
MGIYKFDQVAVAVILIAIASNVVLYSILGLLWWLVARRLT